MRLSEHLPRCNTLQGEVATQPLVVVEGAARADAGYQRVEANFPASPYSVVLFWCLESWKINIYVKSAAEDTMLNLEAMLDFKFND